MLLCLLICLFACFLAHWLPYMEVEDHESKSVRDPWKSCLHCGGQIRRSMHAGAGFAGTGFYKVLKIALDSETWGNVLSSINISRSKVDRKTNFKPWNFVLIRLGWGKKRSKHWHPFPRPQITPLCAPNPRIIQNQLLRTRSHLSPCPEDASAKSKSHILETQM